MQLVQEVFVCADQQVSSTWQGKVVAFLSTQWLDSVQDLRDLSVHDISVGVGGGDAVPVRFINKLLLTAATMASMAGHLVIDHGGHLVCK